MSSEPQGPNQANIDAMWQRMDEVDSISCSMCTAKWLQSTIYLHNGHTHSCHHPPTHKVWPHQVEANPSALHNTPEKKQFRSEMLRGERPKECQYCWNIEDLGKGHISDRVYKSTDVNWSEPYIPQVLEAGDEGDINPSYLEISFSHTCNFKCIYCSPDTSSQWTDEIRKHGPYPTSQQTHNLEWIKKTGRMPISIHEHNPYVEAFWKWWPDLYWDLNTLRITGGEPLLIKDTWKVIEFIKEHPRPDLNLAINTNMGVPEKYIDKLIQAHNDLQGKVKSFEIFTSCEAYGEQAEYIRDGLEYKQFWTNIWNFLESTESNSRVNFMITFNLLSMPSFTEFLKDVHEFRSLQNETDAMNRLPFMIAYLRWPAFLSARIAPTEMKKEFAQNLLTYMTEHAEPEPSQQLIRDGRVIKPGVGRFYLEEIDQAKRLCDFIMTEPDTLETDRKDFGLYIQEYDRRRKKEFRDTFPTLRGFYEECLKND